MSEAAPYYEDIAKAPAGGVTHWVTTEDGVRIRVGLWRGGDRGTILMFPGRTEYIEKYGQLVGDLMKLDFSVAVVDWRGQGLADRALKDRAIGHVDKFSDFQHDVRAMISLTKEHGFPQAYDLIGHSMGGCIGLRTCIERDDINAVIFTGPMWGIAAKPSKRWLGWTVSTLSRPMKLDHFLTPGTVLETYVKIAPFEDNLLTTDPEMFDYMKDQVTHHPELSLGGPSLAWLHEALNECRALARHPSPKLPGAIFLGSNERIVDVAAVHDRAARWHNAEFHIIDGGEHEILMERAPTRAKVMDAVNRLFQPHG